MKTVGLLVLALIAFASGSKASDRLKSIPGFYLYQTKENPSLPNGEAKITLHFASENFENIPAGYQTIIYFSVNELTDTLVLNFPFTHTLSLPARSTVFKFWAGPGYNEVISDTVQIGNRTENEAQVTFHSLYQQIEVDKPVIYLQSPVIVDFSLTVTPAAGFTFTYPAYTGQWKGSVYPDGKIEIGGQKYPYLFWDSKQAFTLTKHTNGYYVSRKEVISFLEKQLSDAGFTSTEKTDFITYWGPRLTQYESVFIQFFLQEDCNQFANIQCEPQPTAINRLYLGFSEWNETFTPYLQPAELSPFKRSGFNLLEWGGFELKHHEL